MGRADEISTHAPAGGATPAGRSRCRPEASYFYSRPCGRGDENVQHKIRIHHDFYSRPCGRGDHDWPATGDFELLFLLTPLREGRRFTAIESEVSKIFLLTPLREGRLLVVLRPVFVYEDFYSRPCGRGDRRSQSPTPRRPANFYSRPCGRGDIKPRFKKLTQNQFLLTPLREGRLELDVLALCLVDFYSRPCGRGDFSQSPVGPPGVISTHAPAGGATKPYFLINLIFSLFLLTPLREGRPAAGRDRKKNGRDFYSRPCGRGDPGK